MKSSTLSRAGRALAFAATLSASVGASAYTQDYVTYWETEAGTGGRLWFNYLVFNTGTADYNWTPLGDGTAHVFNQIPTITSYLVPILSPTALAAIDTTTIYQPAGWNSRFVNATASNWTNTSGNPLFDHPYKLLEWYVPDPAAAPAGWSYWDPRYGIEPSGWPTAADVAYWAAIGPYDDPVNFTHEYVIDPDTGAGSWQSNVFIHSEMIPPAFGFMSYTGKLLGPDETAWTLVTEDYIVPIPPRTGDPDLPILGSGIGYAGIPTPVPEPETYAMMLAGLGALLTRVRRSRRPN